MADSTERRRVRCLGAPDGNERHWFCSRLSHHTACERWQLHDELKAVKLKHQTTSSSVGDLTESLSALSDELQELKEKMDSKGDAVSE